MTVDKKSLSNTNKNDKFEITLGEENRKEYKIPVGKGKDSLVLTVPEGMNGEFEYTKVDDTKDLLITCTLSGEEDDSELVDTITIENYFKTLDANSTSSSVKTVTIVNGEDSKTYNLADLYTYTDDFEPNSKRNVVGTVFSDIIDESGYRNDKN